MTGRPRRYFVFVLAGTIGLCAASGCSKKPKPTVAPPVVSENKTPETPPANPPVETPKTEMGFALGVKDVFFDYDKAIIRGDMQEILSANGKYLVDNPGPKFVIEGHCDERGTVEYNLALGERRAMAAKNYLLQYGVDASRMSTISYGEEKPFAEGHDESAWSQNRRVHFVKQ